jgi:hypothetical protein
MLPVRPAGISFPRTVIPSVLALCKQEKYREIFDTHNQLSITGRDGANVTDGIGSLWDYTLKRFTAKTEDFITVNDDFKDDQYLMAMVTSVKEDAALRGKQIGRIRFMRLKPKTCLTLHKDPDEFRYHIPLETNENCFFVVGEHIYRMPILGETYLIDTRDVHTAVNASNETRIHIVFDTYITHK